jgi:hypothetical protein
MSSSDAIANTDLAGQDYCPKGHNHRHHRITTETTNIAGQTRPSTEGMTIAPTPACPSPVRLDGEHLQHVSRGSTALMSTCNRETPHAYLPPHHLAPRVAAPMSMHERHIRSYTMPTIPPQCHDHMCLVNRPPPTGQHHQT